MQQAAGNYQFNFHTRFRLALSAVSYSKAKAEVDGTTCNVGMFQRSERLFSLGMAAIFTPILSFYTPVKEPYYYT